jgi:S-DNA-T family DNA segregation ATPase FtsK/SpoIIIE
MPPARPLLEDQSRAVPAIAITIPVRLIGMVLLALVALVLAALASWSVDDPSLSYAATTPVRNWLGFPGAVVADLSFQILGLGIIVLLLPPALWGWSFLRRRVPAHMGLRLVAWIAATLLATGVLAFLPVPASWPLPTGLGGLIGAGFANLAALVTGETPQPVTAGLFAIILSAPTLALFWLALGLGTVGLPRLPERSARAPRARPAGDEPERSSVLDVVLGALVHFGFSAHTALRRAIARARDNAAARREADAAPWREDGREPQVAGPAPAELRREPQLARTAYAPEPEDEADEPEADLPPPVAPARPARVVAPARRPAPGARAAREAQPSLLAEDGGFELPALGLLSEARHRGLADEHRPERLEAMARRLEGVLEDFGVRGDIINVRPGPVVTLYELEPAPGIKSSRVISLADDIARSMSAISARVAVVPGRNAIGIELPNEARETVYLREMLASQDFEKMKGKLPICLGKTIGGEPVIADLARMPHLLIAGTTGSGKSVGINTFILSLLYQMTPEQCRLIMIDPKMLELSIYDGIPHLLTPVVTDPAKAVTALKWAVREMEDRYRKMSKIGVRNIDGFNQRVTEAAAKGETITRTVQTGFDRETGEAIYESEEFALEPLPFIVVIIDEMADLMMVAGKDIEGAVQRLAQMARAAGIHVIMATQRPSVDVITGTIKANFPTRISFQVTSKIDSRTILGEQGAEQLLGNGDMLYMAGGGRIRRLHGPFVSDGEVESVVRHLKLQGAPDYLEAITEEEEEFDPQSALADEAGGSGDELYDKAVHIVLSDKKASTSYVQRRLAIGYNKAASLIERMEKEGVISPANHSGKREILVGNNADGY